MQVQPSNAPEDTEVSFISELDEDEVMSLKMKLQRYCLEFKPLIPSS